MADICSDDPASNSWSNWFLIGDKLWPSSELVPEKHWFSALRAGAEKRIKNTKNRCSVLHQLWFSIGFCSVEKGP